MFACRPKLESPQSEDSRRAGRFIVLGRHAGPGASSALVHVLLRILERVPRILLKAQLRLDPVFDVLADAPEVLPPRPAAPFAAL